MRDRARPLVAAGLSGARKHDALADGSLRRKACAGKFDDTAPNGRYRIRTASSRGAGRGASDSQRPSSRSSWCKGCGRFPRLAVSEPPICADPLEHWPLEAVLYVGNHET